MRLLITGGMGFIGSNLTRYMLATYNDVEVVNLDRLSIGSNRSNLRDVEDNRRYRLVKGDLCDKMLIEDLVEDAEAVINVAAETHVDRSIADPWPFLHSNTLGTFTLIEAARKRDVRIVHVSTDELYGEALEGSFKEDARLQPSNPYSASKASADLFILAYHRTYGLKASITRCVNNFGPYQFPEKFIPKTIIRALLNLPIPVYGTGKNVRDWIYVHDHCEALDTVLRRGQAGEVYNISAGNELQNIEVVEAILKLVSKPSSLVSFVEDRPGHDRRYSLDSSKITENLGWKPRHRFQEALQQTVEWYLNNEWWWRPIATEDVLTVTPWKPR